MIEAQLIRLQGMAFCLLCAILLVMNTTFAIQNSLVGLGVITIAILCLGVPHGAFDPIYAKHQYELSTKKQWVIFVLIYLALAFAVVAVFLMFPALFLIGFLILSLLHFSADPENDAAPIFRLIYAGSALILPALLHETQVNALFAHLSTQPAALAVSHFLHLLAYPWFLMALVVAAIHAKSKVLSSLELLSLALIAVLLPPLVSFTVFFCAMHSIRHTLRTRKYATPPTIKNLLRMAILPVLGTAFLLAGAWVSLESVAIEARWVQWLFVALAALTVPHMLLVDRLRLQKLGGFKLSF